MLDLSDYDITPERGFLTPHDMAAATLPPAFDAVTQAGGNLPAFLASGRVRHFLRQVPQTDMAAALPALADAQLRLLMVRYSFIIQAWVWGEEDAAQSLPPSLAVPYCALAEKIGQFPLLPYSAYTLDNWVKLDPTGPVALGNTGTIQNFLGGQDEDWFILVHVEIEARAGRALAAVPALLEAARERDAPGIAAGLETVLAAWEDINPVFDRMVEKCDPYIYYNRVRPYIHGWKGNPATPRGIVYEGVKKFGGKPQAFRGQTGSQSSIVPVMDALLGIAHENDPLREYLDELHAYRPPKHRAFVEAVQSQSTLRTAVEACGKPDIVLLYNRVVDHVQQFRTRHLEYAAHYIHRQAMRGNEGNPTDIGTGGTPFMKYLKKHRDESRAHFIGDYTPMELPPLLKAS